MTPEVLAALKLIAAQTPTKLTSLSQLKESWDEIDAVNQCIAHAQLFFKSQALTLCPHCGEWRNETACRADPFINAEPKTYCPIAKGTK